MAEAAFEVGDPTIADAVLDRLVDNAHRLTLKETACERSQPNAPILTSPRKPKSTHHAGNRTPAAFVETGGRLRSERVAAFNRNPRPQSSESATDRGNVVLERDRRGVASQPIVGRFGGIVITAGTIPTRGSGCN